MWGLADDGDGLVGVGRCARPGVKDFRFLSIDLCFPSRPSKPESIPPPPCASSPPPTPNPYLTLPAPPHPLFSLSLSPSLSLSRTSAVSSSRFFGPVLVKAYVL